MAENQRAYKKNQTKLIQMVVAMVLLCLLGFWLSSTGDSERRMETRITDEAERTEVLLAVGNADSLKNELVRLEQAANEMPATPELIKQFRDRLEISEKLISMDDKAAASRGIIGKLAVLSHWQFLSATRGVETDEQVANLDELAKTFAGSPDKSVSDSASVAYAISGVINHFHDGKVKRFSEVEQRFKMAALQARESVEVAGSLYQTSDWVRSQGNNQEAEKLFKILVNSLRENQSQGILPIRQGALNAFFELKFNLKQLERDIAGGVNEQQITSNINTILQDPDFGSEGFAKLSPMVDVSLGWGRNGLARQILQGMLAKQEQLGDAIDEEATESLSELKARVGSLGSSISFGELKSLNNPEFALNDRGKYGVLVYWTPGHEESEQYFASLKTNAQTLAKNGVDLMTVCDQNLSPAQLAKAKNAATYNKDIHVILAGENDDARVDFARQFPVPQRPFILVLGRSNEILMVNPASGSLIFRGLQRIQSQAQSLEK